MSYIGLRVKILNVDGHIWRGLPIKTGHPEHAGKRGIIACEEGGIPVLDLDDGNTVSGSECWWISLDVAEEVERRLADESSPAGGR